MVGRDIRGISVSIGGDTTKLQSALQGVNKEIKFPRLLVGGGGRLHGRPKDCLRLLFFYGSVLVFPNADSGVKMIHFCFLLHVWSPTESLRSGPDFAPCRFAKGNFSLGLVCLWLSFIAFYPELQTESPGSCHKGSQITFCCHPLHFASGAVFHRTPVSSADPE